MVVPEALLELPGGSLGAPLELDPPPGLSDDGGGSLGLGGALLEGGVEVVGGFGLGLLDGGRMVCEGGRPGPGLDGGGGGRTTLVVSCPSGPTEVTVLGCVELEGAPGTGEPLTVIGLPGTALPGTSWTSAGAVPCPPGTPVPPAVAEMPGPASSAIAAKAVATTRPLTPNTA